MASLSKLYTNYKALVQLGLQPVALSALYRLGLATGHYRRSESREQNVENGVVRPLFTFPIADRILAVIGEDGKANLLAEADEIVAGQVRLFGSQPVPLQLSFSEPLRHWTEYEIKPALLAPLYASLPDVKFIWEPARFGWAFCLGRAFHMTGEEKYAEAFWHNFEVFSAANPPYRGPNWISGQEAALRLMTFVWAAQIFAGAPSRITICLRKLPACSLLVWLYLPICRPPAGVRWAGSGSMKACAPRLTPMANMPSIPPITID